MTFTPISYVYTQTVPRSNKSHLGATKQVCASSKNQDKQPLPATLDTLHPPEAEEPDRSGDVESRMQETVPPPNEETLYPAIQDDSLGSVGEHGSAVGAVSASLREIEEAVSTQETEKSSIQETATSNHDGFNDWPLRLQLLYKAQQERRLGLLGKPGCDDSDDSEEEIEEDVSNQGGGAICSSIPASGDGRGNTQHNPIILGNEDSGFSSSPLCEQVEEGELQEPQRQKISLDAIKEPGDNYGESSLGKHEGERQLHDRSKETSSDIHHSQSSCLTRNTNDRVNESEDDDGESPRAAKRQKRAAYSLPATPLKLFDPEKSQPASLAADLEQEWEIRNIVGQKTVGGIVHYLVDWEPTWMGEFELDGARELIDGFVAQLPCTRRKSWDGAGEGCFSRRGDNIRESDSLSKGEPKRRGRPRKQKRS